MIQWSQRAMIEMTGRVRLLLLLGTTTIVLGGIVRWAIERASRDAPNYSLIDDGLYLGGHVPQPPPGVQAVLNLCENDDPYRVRIHRWEPIADAEPAPEITWLAAMVDFVDCQRRAGIATYVHCQNGVSRSGLVVVAYEMRKNRCSRDEALASVRSKRPTTRPNPAFMQLLLEWERQSENVGGFVHAGKRKSGIVYVRDTHPRAIRSVQLLGFLRRDLPWR